MNIKVNAEVNSGGSWLLTFVAMNVYAWAHAVPFSEFWVPLSALFGWHSGRRLWRELKNGPLTFTNDPECPDDSKAEQEGK